MTIMGREGVLKSLPLFLFLVLTSLILIFLENFGWTKSLHNLVELGSKPVKLNLYRSQQGVSATFSFLTFWRSGEQKIKYLEERNRELLVEAQKVNALIEEDKILRAQLEVALPAEWKLEPAQTIGKTRYLTVDKGSGEGITLGQVAVIKNFLVGRVIKVGVHESQIELPTDPDSKIPVQTVKTRARGLLTGQFGKGLALEKVTQGEILEKEDLVTTTGEKEYPKGLIIGKISGVEKNESELFQKAQVEPSLNFEELEIVFLIKTSP